MSDRREEALAFIESHRVMTLATHGTRGPWASAVFYVNEGFTLTFLSSPRSRHASDLAADSRCGAAVHEDCSDWRQIRGLQLEGNVRALSGGEQRRAIMRYAQKFPVTHLDQAPAVIRAALERVAWYEFVPHRCFFVDNTHGFGHRDEVLLPR